MYQCHILNHLHLSQVILTVIQLGFTETFEHIGPLLTLYIVLLCVSRCADEGLGTHTFAGDPFSEGRMVVIAEACPPFSYFSISILCTSSTPSMAPMLFIAICSSCIEWTAKSMVHTPILSAVSVLSPVIER